MDKPVEDQPGAVSDSPDEGGTGRVLSGAISKNKVDVSAFLAGFLAWCARWTFAVLVFLAVMVGAAWFVFNQAVQGGAYILVPDVTGLPMTRAANVLAEAGLELGAQKQVLTDRVPEYHVIVQRPRPNRVVRAGRKISLTISAGGQVETTPNLIGKTLESALQILEGTRLRAGSVARVPDGTPADTVLSQDPEPRMSTAAGKEVHLLVSDGPDAQPVFMPDIIGESLEGAQMMLANLKVSTVPYKVNRAGAEYEVVLAQYPEPGTLLREGQEVTFDVRLLPSSFLPNARRKASVAYKVPRVAAPVSVRVNLVDQSGEPQLLYPLPRDLVAGRPPRHASGTAITFTEIALSQETTIEFYLDGTLHTSYYFEGDAEPVISTHELPTSPENGGSIVQQEEIGDSGPVIGGPFGRRRNR